MPSTYEPISSVKLGYNTSSIIFSSIPQTYTDLILICNPINTTTTALNIYLNSDTSTNYSCTRMYGEGANRYSDRSSNTASSLGGWGTNTNTKPYIFATTFMNYSNTSTNKSFITRVSEPNANYLGMICSLWRNTSAITTITFFGNANFGIGSTFNLYGIKAA